MIQEETREGTGPLPDSFATALRLFVSQPGPRLLALTLLACVALRFAQGGWTGRDAIIIFLLVNLRSVNEWLMHKYVFDAAPLPLIGVRLFNPISRMHGMHHKNPQAIDELFFGAPGVSLVLGSSALICYLIFRNPGIVTAVTFSAALNLLLYEWFHLLAHSIKICPKSRLIRAIVMNHRNHHFVDGSRFLGVSSLLADQIFGTYE